MVLTVYLVLMVATVPMVWMERRESLVTPDLMANPDEMGRQGNLVPRENKVLLDLSMMDPRESLVSPVLMVYPGLWEQRE